MFVGLPGLQTGPGPGIDGSVIPTVLPLNKTRLGREVTGPRSYGSSGQSPDFLPPCLVFSGPHPTPSGSPPHSCQWPSRDTSPAGCGGRGRQIPSQRQVPMKSWAPACVGPGPQVPATLMGVASSVCSASGWGIPPSWVPEGSTHYSANNKI